MKHACSLVLALAAAACSPGAAPTVDATRGFGHFTVLGVEPWCTASLGEREGHNNIVTCRWLSERHCTLDNQLAVATQTHLCVPNPLPP